MAGEHAGRLDLLVTDVVMPEMNGRDLNQMLRKLHPEMKTLYMSGYTADVISQRGAIEEGASFIQKPFSTTSIASRVRQILDAAEGTDGFRPTP